MALFMKQDFTPPILSRKWFAIKCRPNMLLYSRKHIISILESGLLFREDSVEVEQEAPSGSDVWVEAGGSWGGWATRGEGSISVAAVTVAALLVPPTSLNQKSLLKLSLYASIPIIIRTCHRKLCQGTLAALLTIMKDYLTLARRTAACLKEFAALHSKIESLTFAIESTRTMLCRQQSDLMVLMSRTSSALLGNAPWLRDDVAWDAVERGPDDNLLKIHHAFLVVQSTLLKHIAMAHFVPPPTAQKLYRNHNERIYYLHAVLLQNLTEHFQENLAALDRMYRLLKNSTTRDNGTKKLGNINTKWLYSEVHTGIARVSLELKLAIDKTETLDMFLDSCSVNNQEIDPVTLNQDLDSLIESITKCLVTVQNSQIRLNKLKNNVIEKEEVDNAIANEPKSAPLFNIDDIEQEIKDEVFYFMKTEDDVVQATGDSVTAPGEREVATTKVVLTELRRKLGKREDLMRERERQALVKTMPELKHVPEFPRQIKLDEFVERKGYIHKIKKPKPKKLYKQPIRHKTASNNNKNIKYRLKKRKYNLEKDINGEVYEANALLSLKSQLITVRKMDKIWYVTQWIQQHSLEKDMEFSSLSECSSESDRPVVKSDSKEIKFTKKDLELSVSSSDSDTDYYKNQRELLRDVRRHRVARKKNHPSQKAKVVDNVDESLKPIEYSFGTGLAMASVLQVNNPKFLNCAQEEVFIGDGEVSNDSGNDEDA